MIFNKFGKPKWQHSNADVRKSAVEELDDIEVLKEVAQRDESASVRQVAIRKLTDLQVLDHILQNESDNDTKVFIKQHYASLLCGLSENPPSLETRLSWLATLNAPEILESVALQGKELELRLAAIQKVERQDLLADIASGDNISKVRIAAAEKLTEKSVLESVFKNVRNRDKRVNHIVRDKLEALNRQSERLKQAHSEAEAICNRLEKFGRGDYSARVWEQEYAEFDILQKRWKTVEEIDISPELKSRFTQAGQTFITAYNNFQALQRLQDDLSTTVKETKQAIIVQLESLLVDVQNYKVKYDDTLKIQLDELQRRWSELESVASAGEEERKLENRFQTVWRTIQKLLKELENDYAVANSLESICIEIEHWLADSKRPLKVTRIKELNEKWASIVQPENPPTFILDLNARFAELTKTLAIRSQEQSEQREKNLASLKQVLTKLESFLEQGELHSAIPLEQQAHDLLKELLSLAPKQRKALEERLHANSSKIKELKSWQKWGDDLEREKLCVQMEELARQQVTNPEETARLIREAQTAWKHLGTNSQQTLWERFNSACNAAYEPCKDFFLNRSSEWEQNRQKRVELCEQLEAFKATVNWERPDWKEIQKTVRHIDKSWKSLGITDRKNRKRLKERFDDAMTSIREKLEEEQENNYEFRSELIKKIKKIANPKSDTETSDEEEFKGANTLERDELDKAIEKVKELQNEWVVTVPSSRQKERKIWKDFRKECDVVFDRRQQLREQLDQSLQNNLVERETLCEQIEALAKTEGNDVKGILGQSKKLQLEWPKLGNVPKKSQKSIEKRFVTACKKVEKHYQTSLVKEHREQLELLKKKANLCAEIEKLTQTQVEETQIRAQALRKEWEDLPNLMSSEWETTIQQRFENAQTALLEGRSNISATALKNKETLCIRMEILAEVDSPPEVAQARMAYQVARLSEAMSGAEIITLDKFTEVGELEKEWYLCGAIPMEKNLMLEQRFERAIEAFYDKNPK